MNFQTKRKNRVDDRGINFLGFCEDCGFEVVIGYEAAGSGFRNQA
jgi:hypothetical protein